MSEATTVSFDEKGLIPAVVQDADDAVDALTQLVGRRAGSGIADEDQAEGQGDQRDQGTQAPHCTDSFRVPAARCWAEAEVGKPNTNPTSASSI